MPNTLNEFIEEKVNEFLPLVSKADSRVARLEDFQELVSFLRSALRECAEKTADAVNLDQQRFWFNPNPQPHA